MAWLRVGDTFSTHPLVLALLDPAEPLAGPAAKGFFLELAALSANALTDYEVTEGFINLAGGAAAPDLLKRCMKVGLIRSLGGRGQARRWKLIDTAPELIHIRLKAEVSWERQQKSDTGNPVLRAAAYLRDGDSCRYCGVVVQPSDNMSARGRTLDHVRPGEPARTAADLVVCCRRCNGARGKDWQNEEQRDSFADRWKLRRPPSPLIFIRSTVTWLDKQGHTIPTGSVIVERADDAEPTPQTPGPEVSRSASQANAAAPAQGTTAPDATHTASQAVVAATGTGTDGATHPAPAGVAAPTTTDTGPPSAGSHDAPECQHPAPAGVAVPESRTDRSATDRFGTAGPGRVGSGSGLVGSGGGPPPPGRGGGGGGGGWAPTHPSIACGVFRSIHSPAHPPGPSQTQRHRRDSMSRQLDPPSDTDTRSELLCVLGCADRTRTEVWPRPPRPRADGLLTCRPCADRIRDKLAEVLELAVNLDLVTAAGSAPAGGRGGGRKRIKDEPVAPVPVSVPTAALTDVRSRRGTWVPDPVTPIVTDEQDDVEDTTELLADLEETVAAESKRLNLAIAVFGARSEQARTAAADLDRARATVALARRPRRRVERSIDPRDNDPASVVGFLDRWTDKVRVGRNMLGAGTCPARLIEYVPIRTGPFGSMQGWPRTVECGLTTEYRRLIRFEMGARTTGLLAVCSAGHVTRPEGQGDQPLGHRGGHGHRPGRGARHGLTIFAAINLLRTHNDWVCAQDWVADYWRGLRELRSELGRAFGEPRPSRIGVCPNGTGQVDEKGEEIECGTPLSASPYSDTIECPKCGRVWTHREWRFLGRRLGVIA